MIKSLLKAIDILDAFTPSEPRLSLAEISVRLSLPKSTAHNLLHTLMSRGWVEQINDQYALGMAILPLAQAVRVNAELRDRAAPLLRQLADACRESVYLAVFYGECVLYIYAVESPQRLRARTAVGDCAPLHCTSAGKAIVSQLTQEQVEGIVALVGLPRSTAATITELGPFLSELELTRRRGYAVDAQEHEPSTFCIGVPIFDSAGNVVAACSVSGVDPDIVAEKAPAISGQVRRVAEEISARIGYIGPRKALVMPAHVSRGTARGS